VPPSAIKQHQALSSAIKLRAIERHQAASSLAPSSAIGKLAHSRNTHHQEARAAKGRAIQQQAMKPRAIELSAGKLRSIKQCATDPLARTTELCASGTSATAFAHTRIG
jgi:hypothetical protein